jgi:integrase
MSPRYRESNYRLFTRKMRSGLTVWYYYVYDDAGKRVIRSTGIGFKSPRDKARTKREAEAYVDEVMESGTPYEVKAPTLSRWIADTNFWDWHRSDYVRTRLAWSDSDKPAITKSYVQTAAQITKDHILPFHGDKQLDQINKNDCEALLLQWINEGASNKSAMNWRSVYSVILAEAVRLEIIEKNPWDKVPRLSIKKNQYGAITAAEVAKIISPDGVDFSKQANRIYWNAVRLAFLTGLRVGEVAGIHTDSIRDEYIQQGEQEIRLSYLEIKYQWNQKTLSRGLVKDKDVRRIPITAEIRDALEELAAGKEGYIFSFAPSHSYPISQNKLRDWLYNRMDAVNVKDRKDRNITFHSARRFFNTALRHGGVSDDIIRKFTGHNSGEMTDHYTDYLPAELQEISKIQAKLLEAKE